MSKKNKVNMRDFLNPMSDTAADNRTLSTAAIMTNVIVNDRPDNNEVNVTAYVSVSDCSRKIELDFGLGRTNT